MPRKTNNRTNTALTDTAIPANSFGVNSELLWLTEL
jgi:hypothetical protein